MKSVDLLIKNANELITVKGPNKPRTKKEMNDLGIIPKGCIAVDDGKIVDIGKNLRYTAETVVDADGKTVMPGFVDPHTHVVFAGSREFELDMKLHGWSYMDIMNQGGGIFYTVNETRKASIDSLIEQSSTRLDTMLKFGTTTCIPVYLYTLPTSTHRYSGPKFSHALKSAPSRSAVPKAFQVLGRKICSSGTLCM